MVLEKVVAFVTKGEGVDQALLLIEHPIAGLQLPAGTVECKEAPLQAMRRELAEEAGLTAVALVTKLASFNQLEADKRVLCKTTPLYEKPDGLPLAHSLRRGWYVHELERMADWVAVRYEEWQYEAGQRQTLLFARTGWVPTTAVATQLQRHLYHFRPTAPLPDVWWIEATDEHTYGAWRLFWQPLATAVLVDGQQQWLQLVRPLLLNTDISRPILL